MEKTDVIIIGAGAAGLVAAKELTAAGKRVLVLEASDRAGGRIRTLEDARFPEPVELGAEFIHGNFPDTFSLLREAGIKYSVMEADFARFAKGRFLPEEDAFPGWDKMVQKACSLEQDMPLQDFLNTYFAGRKYASLRKSAVNYAAGYDAADARDASTVELFNEWEEGDEDQYRIEGGYHALVRYLAGVCIDGDVRMLFSDPVNTLSWEKGRVTAHTLAGNKYSAEKVILTVPVSLLREKAGIRFEPEIPDIRATACKIGFGPVFKIVARFTKPFWKSIRPADHTLFVLSDRKIPTWWTSGDAPVITGWAGGKFAEQLSGKDKKGVTDLSVRTLAAIFHLKASEVRSMLVDLRYCDWASDPFALGAYSYAKAGYAGVRGCDFIAVEDTVYFAGEGYVRGKASGTVEAALVSGRKVAGAIAGSN